MAQRPKISVIVPIYNVEKYLAKCLDSIIGQTLKEIEIICVNDGSTDNSTQILKEYATRDNRIKVIQQKNGGLSAARNTGLKHASTELIAFMDSDDILEPETYKTAISKMTTGIDIVCFGIKTVGGNSKALQKADDDYYNIKFQGKTELTKHVLQNTDVSPCNKIFRKSLIEKYKLQFPVGLRYEDAYFFNIYALQSKFAFYIKDKFYNYIRHNDSIMGQTFSGAIGHSIDHLMIAVKLYEYLKDNDLFAKHKTYFGKCFFAFLDFALRHEQNKTGRQNIYDMAINFLHDNHLYFPDFAHWQFLLKQRSWNGEFSKYLFGVIKTRVKNFNKRILFCGMPIMRIKYKPNDTKYYLMAIVPVYKRKLHKGPDPAVSVLMPTYNAGKYIGPAIESILNQTFTDFEFIIINDGSTDNTANIVENYKDRRIKFINNQQNRGLVAVLNQGLDMCTGKYIARMDSDDISLPTRFEKQIKFMQRNKNVGILGTWFHIFGNGFDRVEKKPSYPKLSDMIKSSPVGHPTVMMRRSVLDKNNLRYDARYKHAEDYELWARAKKYTKIANLQTVLLEYRWSGNNVSSIYETEQIQTSEVIKQKIRRLLGETKKLTKITNIDDKPVLDELKKLGQFTYMPNSGNMGDALIASATMNWFDRNNVNYMRAVPDTFPENFVYGGGGAWLSRWIKDLAPVMNIMKQAKRVVILPSSFNNVPELVEILDERFIVFCREKSSFDYLVAQKTSAKIILDHDMALRYGDKIKSVPRAHSKRLNKLGKKLKRNLGKIKKCANLFRTDCESAGHYETDLDLSDCMGWFSPYQSRQDIDFAAYTMLNTMYKYDRVCTDRLHVGIAAILAGTDAELYDNTYGKISGVYNQSLDKLSIAHLVKKGD